MRFAVSLPNFGELGDPSVLVDLAVRAESAGWSGFYLWDHIVLDPGLPFSEPWVTLGAIAQATSRIRIGPMVTPIPRRRPWVVAREVVTLDHLSGGRVDLGVGIGHPPSTEFGTFGEPEDPRTRANMLEEGLAIIEGILSGESFEFSGEYYTVRENRFAPKPVQPRIPIWVASARLSNRPIRRAARFDGYFPICIDGPFVDPSALKEDLEYLSLFRDSPIEIILGGPPDPDLIAAYEEVGVTVYMTGPDPFGTLDQIRADIEQGPPRRSDVLG